ncbi:NAD-dependent epimerase/dehydratase family protein [Hellea balneolensis]|uniref:NAD-dependent epimerase/dehydratase family protein n=1 Tax=Hellea balneolensis TaxID=287478 RepID=UPI000407BDB4|nr:NAD(P)H-binding protein [Hellea balneolensis]
MSPLIAVTGGTGFIGRHMVKALLAAGYRVRALARTPSKLSDLTHDNLHIFQGRLGSDDMALIEGADVVLHMAGLIKARTERDIMSVNRDAAGDIAASAQAANVKRFILLSSQTAAQPQLSDYAKSKHAGEEAVKTAYIGKLAIIRAPAVFGPGDEATKPFFDFIAKGRLPVAGGPDWRARKMAMVFAADLARDIVNRAISGGYDGQIVTPCTIPALTWEQFAQDAGQALGIAVKVTPIPLPMIKAAAGLTSVTSRLFGVGHLTLGKLREFLYEDWSSQDVIQNATPFIEALRITAASYEKE